MAQVKSESFPHSLSPATKTLSPTLQPPSFNGALSQYAFTPPSTTTRRLTRSTTNSTTPASTPKPVPFLTPSKPIPSPTKSSPLKRSISKSSTTSSSSSPNKRPLQKRSKKTAGYQPPSTYAHLPNHLRDTAGPNLLVLLVGLNPGLATAQHGHAYAHPSNLFWKLLHSSGLTPDRRCRPSEDQDLPARYALGNTNIVTRQTRDGAGLSKGEMDESVAVLEEKIRTWRPEVVCLVGKGVWESVERVKGFRERGKSARDKERFKYGWRGDGVRMGIVSPPQGDGRGGGDQEMGSEAWPGSRIFVATSTSGLAAGMKPAEKEAVWKELGDWVQMRRRERAEVMNSAVEGSDVDVGGDMVAGPNEAYDTTIKNDNDNENENEDWDGR